MTDRPTDRQAAERIAALLYDHREDAFTCYDHGGYCCVCGVHDMAGYRWHLAEVIAALLDAHPEADDAGSEAEGLSEAEVASTLTESLNVVAPLRHIFGSGEVSAREAIDALEVLLAQEVEHAAHILAARTAAASARIEQARSEGAAEALREFADLVDKGPTFLPLPPTVFSAMARERADDNERGERA